MRTICILFVTLMMSCFVSQAQTSPENKAVTHFYIVNLDEELVDVFTSTKTDNKTVAGNEFIQSVIDTFYTIASAKFKNELGLELLPLAELNGKVKYNNQFPNCPDMTNIKKVLKHASGYKYYMDYFVNVFSDVPESSVTSLPTRIKPLYAISFTIYDGSGRQVKKIDLSYKSKKPLIENKQDMSRVSQVMKIKLSSYYSEALNGVTLEYKKRMTAQL
jgi:hypothetical protein